MNTGEIIGHLAQQKGFNLRQLAINAEIPYNTIYAIVKRKSKRIDSDTLNRIAAVLEVPVSDLLGKEEKPTPEGERSVSVDDLKMALFGGDGEVTDEMWEEAVFAAELIKNRHRRKKD